MPREGAYCPVCHARQSSLAFATADLAVVARKLSNCREAARPTFMKQVATAKVFKAEAVAELQRHQSECPIYNEVEETVEEPPARSFREMQEAFLPPYPQSHPEDGEYF